ncbi:MAG: hypothetical protein KUG79_18675 [Pseudomonadales bacterium]|nr:hypothetical protein [Pseudomonadales bacterium]
MQKPPQNNQTRLNHKPTACDYVKPKLILYGKIADLTASGGSACMEGNGMMGMGGMSMTGMGCATKNNINGTLT